MRAIFLAAAAAATWAGAMAPAGAQDDAFVAKMRAVNANVAIPDQREIAADALSTLKAIAARESQCAPTAVRMEKPTPASADPMAMQSIDAGKIKNAWLAYGVPIGCAKAPKTRFFILQTPDDKILARVVNNGESIASPALMRDTSMNAALAAYASVKAIDPACDGEGMAMVETRISSKSDNLSPDFYGVRFKGSWEEVWTFGVCGRLVAVPVSFQADGSGGAYTHVGRKSAAALNP